LARVPRGGEPAVAGSDVVQARSAQQRLARRLWDGIFPRRWWSGILPRDWFQFLGLLGFVVGARFAV
jgi:hypothetical protein